MKCKVTFENEVVENGKVNVQVATKTAEEAAEKAFDLGLGQGLVIGGLLATGVCIAVDAVCSFFSGDGRK